MERHYVPLISSDEEQVSNLVVWIHGYRRQKEENTKQDSQPIVLVLLCSKQTQLLHMVTFLRSSGRKKHFIKINFKAEQDYIDAQEHESKARGGLTVDFEKTLEYMKHRK